MNGFSGSSMLAVDVGNSAVKIGHFHVARENNNPEPIAVFRTDARSPDFEKLRAWMPAESVTCYLASVYREAAQAIVDWMEAMPSISAIHQLQHHDFPIPISVDHPEQVGQDRLANAVAARFAKAPGSSAIVVDAGTAITVDLVTSAGQFCGGAILAGQQASALALSAGTDLLPVISTVRMDDPPQVVGRGTEAAIRSGIFWGAVGSIREIVGRMQSQVGPANEVFLTGGDMPPLIPHLGPQARYVPDLVLSGIAVTAQARTSSA